MRVGSCFSGIGGFDLGLEQAGWEVVWQIENDPFCNKILARHWPEVARYEDITTVDAGILERVDLLCGGFPCQDLSVAGKRAGLAGSRSSLFWEFLRIADVLEPRWLLIENVPGLFSSNDGGDFARILEALDERGYGVAWRVLDSQNFGVAQRRRRVFIVGHLGAPCPPEVLFEPESLSRDTQAGEESGPEVAGSLNESFGSHGNSNDRGYVTGTNIAYALRSDPGGTGQGHNVSYALHAGAGQHGISQRDRQTTLVTGPVLGAESHNGNSNAIAGNYVVNARQNPIVGKPSLDTYGNSHAVAVRVAQTGANGIGVTEDGTTHTLDGAGGDAVIATGINVSGLRGRQPGSAATFVTGTPANSDRVRETSGLSGRVDPPDGPRYRALGNAVTVSVARWVGERILAAAVRRAMGEAT